MDVTPRMENPEGTRNKRRGRPSSGRAPPNAGRVQSLDRALNLLECLAKEEGGMSLTDLAQRVALAPSTAHRLLKTLARRRFAHHDEERGLWFVGVQAFTVGNAFLRGRDFVGMARPIMRKLMEDSGESVNLAVLDDGAVVYLTQVECHEMMRALARPGGRAPIHCSGVGKALLSALPKTEVDSILARHGLALHTRKTVTDPVELKRALEGARQRRFALDDEEQVLGMRCVAAVIYDEYAYPLAAISLSGPTARITDRRIDGLGMLAVRAADEVTDKIGGRRPG